MCWVTILDVILAWLACRAGRWVAWLFPWAVGGAVAAEEAPAYNDETSSSPSNIQSTAEFIPGNDSHVTLRLVRTFRKDRKGLGFFSQFTSISNLNTNWLCYIQFGLNQLSVFHFKLLLLSWARKSMLENQRNSLAFWEVYLFILIVVDINVKVKLVSLA